MRRTQFDSFRKRMLSGSNRIPEQAREPYRKAIIELLESEGDFLIQKARKDGHDEALLEIHASWVGTAFSTEAVVEALQRTWPGAVFEGTDEMHWIESEDEVVTLEFAWAGQIGYLTGRIKVNV